MNLDKMTMEEIKQYVKELEDFKEKVSSYSPEELRALKMLYAETRIKMLIGRFLDMIKIDQRGVCNYEYNKKFQKKIGTDF